jgi:uncharacterized lipoprotein YddW (UPF0748 family)
VARYPIDGLHLDYVRFPNEPVPGATVAAEDYPRDARTLALFRAESGRTPEQDPQAWSSWRAGKVTELMRRIRTAMRNSKPYVTLSAAVGPEPQEALARHHQDVRTWLDEDLVDEVYPMNYSQDRQVFQQRLKLWQDFAGDARVVMGVRLAGQDVELEREQLRAALDTFRGYAIFAYSSLFDSPNTTLDQQTEEARERRQEHRHAILPVLGELAYGGARADD